MNRTQVEETSLDAAIKHDTRGHDPDQLFELIESWPERFGKSEWRKRAHRELDGPLHEAFIAYKNKQKGLDEDAAETSCPEWELFNATRAKLDRRRKALNAITEGLDVAAGIAGFCTPLWAFAWYLGPSWWYSIAVLGAHLVILLLWAIFRLARWRDNLRNKRKLRFERHPGRENATEAVAKPLRYIDDRIPACEFEGRKYRSNALLNKAMNESHERRQYEQVGREAQKPGAERSMEWIINVFMGVIALGFLGLLEGGREGHAPLWLSIALIVLGGIGFFLTVRLRDRLHEAKHRY